MAAALDIFNAAKNILETNENSALKSAANEEKSEHKFIELSNVTDAAVASLFMNGKPEEHYVNERPILAIIIGAPGVGKTSQAYRFLNHYLARKNVVKQAGVHLTYDDFYNVSLDTLIQSVVPYRDATMQTHNDLRRREGTYSRDKKYKLPLTDAQYAAFSDMYLQIVQSKHPDFSVAEQTTKLRMKLGLKTVKGGVIRTKPRDNAKPGLEYYCKHCREWFKTKKTVSDHYAKYGEPASPVQNAASVANAAAAPASVANAAAAPASVTNAAAAPASVANAAVAPANSVAQMAHVIKRNGSLLNAMYNGLEYGLTHSFNVLFDTTLKDTKKKIDDRVLPILLRPEVNKYKIIIIHVTAKEAEVKQRLQKRHIEMIHDNFLRAVNPNLANTFIVQNKNGYEDAFRAYKDSANPLLKDSKYVPSDFKFYEVVNSHGVPHPEVTNSPFYSPQKSPKYTYGHTMKKPKF
jgi:hypothetical protein